MTLTDIVLQYNQKFDTGFPTMTFAPDKAMEIMKECIKKGKDAYAGLKMDGRTATDARKQGRKEREK